MAAEEPWVKHVVIFCPDIGTPAELMAGAESGNRVTAARIARHFQDAGLQAQLCFSSDLLSFDFSHPSPALFIGLHLIKAQPAVCKLWRESPGSPVVLVSTGTDLAVTHAQLHELYSERQSELNFVTFHSQATQALPSEWRLRCVEIAQSVELPNGVLTGFDGRGAEQLKLTIAGHLRRVKDPLLIVAALGLLPSESRIQAQLFGAVLENEFHSALRQAESQPRFSYGGAVERFRVLSELSCSFLCVLTSLSEGQPGILLESLALGTPVLCTRIAGNLSVVGTDYPGLFECGDFQALAALMNRAEQDREFYLELKNRAFTASQRFSVEREGQSWLELFRNLSTGPSSGALPQGHAG